MRLFSLHVRSKNHYQKKSLSIFSLATFFLASLSSFGQTSETFTSSGSFTVPCGVTSITVHVYGGGASGGSSNTGGEAGGGGGAGGYGSTTFAVLAGQVFPYVVGTGGAPGANNGSNGNPGTASSWDGGAVSANGGAAGIGDNAGPGDAAGGTAVGTTTITGGTGLAGGTMIGGFGGTNSGPDGGTGGPGGAPGVNGGAASNYGAGGGGGGDKNSGSNTSGGAGSGGAVVVTYTSTVTMPLAGGDQNGCAVMTLAGNTPDVGWVGTWSVVSGSATIASPNDPNSGISGIASGSCATIRWTFTMAGCPDQTDDVELCVPNVCNDEPCNADPITVGTSCSYTTYDNTGGTVSSGMYEPACASFNAATSEDLWYSAVVPANGTLTIQAIDAAGGGSFYPGIAIYSGPCNDLMHQGCDQTTSTVVASILNYSGTPGETIYIRVWDYLDNTGSYNLCAFTHANATGTILTGSTTIACPSVETFMDPGGTGNYLNEQSGFWTICPDTPGEYVSINFTSFALETNFDFLTVMDGGDGSSPIIGNYTGATNPGTITSSAADGCLTFMFRSDNIGTAAGWTADVSCTSTAGSNTIICTGTNCPGECGTWVCSDGLYPTENQGGSSVEEITYQSSGCWSGAVGEISTSWFYFTALTSGTVEMTFDGPNGQDYDFAVYGPSTNDIPPCPSNTGDSPIRCSYSAAANPVGIGNGATDLYEDAAGDGWVAALDVIAGETYVLAFNIFQNGNPQPIIDITFGGTGTLDCSAGTLPIVLSSFQAMNQGSRNFISWVTNTELNNDFFTVERSVDASNWEVVSTKDGAGTSIKPLYYSLEDYNFYSPVTYYRLKQTDYDGKSVYSDIISVNVDNATTNDIVSSLFPNPAENYATFSYTGKNANLPLTVSVTSSTGKEISSNVYETITSNFSATIDTKDLSAGVYHVIFTQGFVSTIQKLVIVRK